MPGFGVFQRVTPQIQVLRGWDPNEPCTFLSTLPSSETAGTIESGMVISPVMVAGVLSWQLGWSAGTIPHFAVDDDDAHDVVEAGVLGGLSCAGQFRIQTGFFEEGSTYTPGITPLTADDLTGDVKPTTLGAGVTEPILGYVHGQGDHTNGLQPKNLATGPHGIGQDDEAAPRAAGDPNYPGMIPVIEFDTALDMNNTPV